MLLLSSLNSLLTYPQQTVSLVENEKLSAAGFIEVAGEPGGDFYDVYDNGAGKTCFIIGDVSGKGQAAAAYMRETQQHFRQLAVQNLAPSDLINRLNEAVSASYDKLHFITLTYVEVDINKKQFSYIRAGHCPLLYFSAAKNECRYFEDKGLGLGIIRDNAVFSAQLLEYKVNYCTNDILVLFTDGLIETVDTLTDAMYDMDKVKTTLIEYRDRPAADICNGILNAFSREISQPKNPDDMALIVIKFA